MIKTVGKVMMDGVEFQGFGHKRENAIKRGVTEAVRARK